MLCGLTVWPCIWLNSRAEKVLIYLNCVEVMDINDEGYSYYEFTINTDITLTDNGGGLYKLYIVEN